MAEQKKVNFSWSSVKSGFLSIICRNSLLVIAINLANTFGNNMKNGFRTLVGNDIGLTGTAIGFAVTLFSIAGLVIRTPTGSLMDTRRSKLKYFLAAGGLIKFLVFLCYPLVKSQLAYDILFFLDGCCFAYIGTMVPACLALSVDRKAMGSAYAIYMGLMTMLGGIAKATGINLYNNYGVKTASWAAAATSLLIVVLALCVDGKQWAIIQQPEAGEKAAPKKKGLLAGFSVSMLPLAICCALCIVAQTGDSTFAPIYSKEMGFNYAGAVAASGVVYGLVTFVVTVLCDFLNPAALIYLTVGGLITGNVLMAVAGTNTLFCVGVWCYNLSRCYNSPFKVIGMKAVAGKEQGALSATMLLMTDIVALFAATIDGVIADKFGYTGVYWFSVVVLVIDLAVFTILKLKGTFDYKQKIDE